MEPINIEAPNNVILTIEVDSSQNISVWSDFIDPCPLQKAVVYPSYKGTPLIKVNPARVFDNNTDITQMSVASIEEYIRLLFCKGDIEAIYEGSDLSAPEPLMYNEYTIAAIKDFVAYKMIRPLKLEEPYKDMREFISLMDFENLAEDIEHAAKTPGGDMLKKFEFAIISNISDLMVRFFMDNNGKTFRKYIPTNANMRSAYALRMSQGGVMQPFFELVDFLIENMTRTTRASKQVCPTIHEEDTMRVEIAVRVLNELDVNVASHGKKLA